MDNQNYRNDWIDIISKIYTNLHTSKSVMHVSKESDKKRERLIKYFERLELIHEKAAKSKRKNDLDLLKLFYYNIYIIKEEDIPESYYQTQAQIAKERGYGNIEINDNKRKEYANQIIEDQKRSLDKWIEYFLYDEESKSYEMWEKYWVFQGIKNLGKYNKETGKFQKRENETVYIFPPVDRELVFTTLKLMEDYLKEQKKEEEISSALVSGNFKQLYEYSIKMQLTRGDRKNFGNDGNWIKYDQGSDYNILRDSLQEYYTGWCTAAGENFAKSQLANGDFYVYYSFDLNGEAKIPRIAIRMDGKNTINEIRGIADNQNMEEEMLPILDEKLKDFPDRKKYYKKENDMKNLTIVYKKVDNNEELSMEELFFLYEIQNKIDGFGYEKDPRIKEIKAKRNQKKDYAKIYQINEDEIALSQEEYFENPTKYKCLIGDLNLRHLTSAEGLDLPQSIGGYLNLSGLTSAEGLVLPKSIGGNLDLRGLTSAEGVVFPQSIGGDLYLSGLTSAEGLVLPQNIGGKLYLSGLTSAEELVFPQIIEGSLILENLTSAEGLVFPQSIGGGLYLSGLTSAEGLVLPQNIGGDLNLMGLTSAEGLDLPQSIGGYLNLSGLKSAEGLVLPQNIGGNLYLDGLTSAEGLVLPKSIGGNLDLSGLTSAEGIVFPKSIGGNLDLSGLTSAEGIVFPQSIGGNLDLSGLTSAEGVVFPQSIIGSLGLSGLTGAEGVVFTQSIIGFLDLSGLKSAEGVVFPQSIIGSLDLSGLKSAEGLVLPQSIGDGLYLSGLTSAEGVVFPQSIGGDLYLSGLTSAEGLVLPQSIGGILDLSGLTSAEGLVLPQNFDIEKLYCNRHFKNEILNEILSNPGKYYRTSDEEIEHSHNKTM